MDYEQASIIAKRRRADAAALLSGPCEGVRRYPTETFAVSGSRAPKSRRNVVS